MRLRWVCIGSMIKNASAKSPPSHRNSALPILRITKALQDIMPMAGNRWEIFPIMENRPWFYCVRWMAITAVMIKRIMKTCFVSILAMAAIMRAISTIPCEILWTILPPPNIRPSSEPKPYLLMVTKTPSTA